MNCFKNLIGIESCRNTTTPKSGYYINHFAGGSIRTLDALVDSEQRDYLKLFNQIEDISILEFSNEIKNQLSKKTLIKESFDSNLVGAFDDLTTLIQTSNYVGINFYGTKEKYTSLNISDCVFYSKADYNDFKIYLYDLNSGIKMLEITQDVTIGFNIININYSYSNSNFTDVNIFLCYNSNLYESVETVNYCDCYEFETFYNLNTKGLSIPLTSQLIKSNANNLGNLAGLQVNFNLSCEFDLLICQNIKKFTEAFANKLLANIMLQRKFSERLNLFTVDFTNEQIDKMIEDYTNKSKQLIELVTDNIQIPCSICFEKNRQVQNLWIRP
jgi:hypothetical protein